MKKNKSKSKKSKKPTLIIDISLVKKPKKGLGSPLKKRKGRKNGAY